MNILIDKFPTKVKIDGKVYELNTDFRVGLKIMFACQDSDLTNQEKTWVMLNLIYKELPSDLDKACEYAMQFLDCSMTSDMKKRASIRISEACPYSFKKDAQYIYSAIKQAHGIDLETIGYLHWWKFVFMFLDLNENCQFYRIIGLRERKRKNKLTKEEREWCSQHKDIISLPIQLTAEEKAKIARYEELIAMSKSTNQVQE